MKTFFSSFLAVFLIIGFLDAGVIHKHKSEVIFNDVGTYIVTITRQIEGESARSDMKRTFQGSNFLKNMIAKVVFKPGSTTDLTFLDKDKSIAIKHKLKSYTTASLKDKNVYDYEYETDGENSGAYQQRAEEQDYEIVRDIFTVNETGKTKKISGFDTKQFLITWVVEWVNNDTERKGTDSLLVQVWTTPEQGDLKKAQKEEAVFDLKHLKLMGVDINLEYNEILGTQWFAMFHSVNQTRGTQNPFNEDAWGKELQKISGFPIVTEGKYYEIRPEEEVVEEVKPQPKKKKFDWRNPTKSISRVVEDKLDKETTPTKTKKPKPDFHYRTVLLKLETTIIKPNTFDIPKGYKNANAEK